MDVSSKYYNNSGVPVYLYTSAALTYISQGTFLCLLLVGADFIRMKLRDSACPSVRRVSGPPSVSHPTTRVVVPCRCWRVVALLSQVLVATLTGVYKLHESIYSHMKTNVYHEGAKLNPPLSLLRPRSFVCLYGTYVFWVAATALLVSIKKWFEHATPPFITKALWISPPQKQHAVSAAALGVYAALRVALSISTLFVRRFLFIEHRVKFSPRWIISTLGHFVTCFFVVVGVVYIDICVVVVVAIVVVVVVVGVVYIAVVVVAVV